MSPIIEEADEEEDEMTTNLRADFCEKQKKKLSKVIEVRPSTKKQNTSSEKGLSSKLVVIPLTTSIHLFPFVPKVVDVESILFHGLGETITILGYDSTLSAQPPSVAPADVLNSKS